MPNTQEQDAHDSGANHQAPTMKTLQIDAAVHERLRRRVGEENAAGKRQLMTTLASDLLTEGLDRLKPLIQPLPQPPAA